MTVLTGARVVLPDREIDRGTVVIDGDRIVDIKEGVVSGGLDYTGHVIVPGFVDVHMHGVEGLDTLASEGAARRLARRLPKYGVAAFCPTTVACPPDALKRLLDDIRDCRLHAEPGAARVLPAHLESNFINPEYRGAQPLECLRRPDHQILPSGGDLPAFSGAQILEVIDQRRAEVGIVTMAAELEGGLDLVRRLVANGHIVSQGHSGATYEEGLAGFEAGARHATHLFNRMPPLSHRAPGLIGAILERPEVRAEIVSDCYHVHAVVARAAIRALGIDRVMAITDATAGAGLPVGTRVPLGNHTITVKPEAAFLPDGTLAGSTLTMDGAFRNLVRRMGLTLVEAARLCSTNPARQLGLKDTGRLEPGALADLTVLDGALQPVATWVNGERYDEKVRPSETDAPQSV